MTIFGSEGKGLAWQCTDMSRRGDKESLGDLEARVKWIRSRQEVDRSFTIPSKSTAQYMAPVTHFLKHIPTIETFFFI